MIYLKQSTAATIKAGPFVDATDGVTAEAALTIQKANVRLSKNGGNIIPAVADQGASDAGAAYDEVGMYDLSLGATDTNTLGILTVNVADAAARPVFHQFMVVPANTYDALVGGTAILGAGVALAALSTAPGAAPTFLQALELVYMTIRGDKNVKRLRLFAN